MQALRDIRIPNKTVLAIPIPFNLAKPPNQRKTLPEKAPQEAKPQYTKIYAHHKKIKQTPAYLVKLQAHLNLWPFGIGKLIYAQITKPFILWILQPVALVADIIVGPLALLSPAKARARNYLQMGLGLITAAAVIYILLNSGIPGINPTQAGIFANSKISGALRIIAFWAPVIFVYTGTSLILASFRYRMTRSYTNRVTAKFKHIPAFDSGVEFYLGDKHSGVRLPLTALHTGVSIYGSIGSGKCLAPNTLCMKWDGTLILAKDIKPGDLLRGPDNKPRRVLTTTTGYGPLYQIIPSPGHGQPWICNAPHILTLKYEPRDKYAPSITPAADKKSEKPQSTPTPPAPSNEDIQLVIDTELNPAQQRAALKKLAKNQYITDVPLEDFLQRATTRLSIASPTSWKLFRAAAEFGDNTQTAQLSPEEFYLAGCWIGAGNKHDIRWQSVPPDIHQALRTYYRPFLPSDTPEDHDQSQVAHGSHFNYYNPLQRIACPLDRLISEFTNYKWFGLTQCQPPAALAKAIGKEADQQIPHWALTASSEKRLQLLAGLIDTLGQTAAGSPRIHILDSRKWIADSVVWLARSLGISAREPQPQAKHNPQGAPTPSWGVHLSGNIQIIPTRVIPMPDSGHNPDPLTYQWNAKPIGDGPYCGFTLDGDGRFLLGDFTVTHNTQAIMNPLLNDIIRQLNLPEPTEAEKRDPVFNQSADFIAWAKDPRQKVGGLILDRKGDFVDFVIYTMLRHGRPLTDLIILDPEIELWRYNLLDTSLPKSTYAQYNSVRLAEMQKIAAGPQGGAGNEKFWDEASRDTVAMLLHILVILKPRHTIGLHHLARLVLEDDLCQDYCNQAEEKTKKRYANNEISLDEHNSDMSVIASVQNKWIRGEAEKIKPTLKLTVTQLLGEFAANPKLTRIFCMDTNFDFQKVINEGLVVLFRGGNTPIATCRKICVALKADFQDWMVKRAGSNAQAAGVQTTRSLFFYIDEYQEFVSPKDSEYLAIARSAKNIPVVATQGVTSYKKAFHGDETETRNLLQGLATSVFLKTNDKETAQFGEDLVGECEEYKERESISAAGLLDQTLHASTSGAREQEVSLESKDYKKYYRMSDFMRLTTQDGHSSSAGPYFSEAIIINYHELDNKRKKGRAYKTKLKHVYYTDKQYDRDLKSGKVARNTLALNFIMQDCISQITAHLLFYSTFHQEMLRQSTSKDNFLAAVESRKKTEKRIKLGQDQAKHNELQRQQAFENELPHNIQAAYSDEALNPSSDAGHLPLEDYNLKNYQEWPLQLLEAMEEIYRTESAKIKNNEFEHAQLQRLSQREINRLLEIMENEHRWISIELNRRALTAATDKITAAFDQQQIFLFKGEPQQVDAARLKSERLSDQHTNQKYANLAEVVQIVVAAKTGIDLKAPLKTDLDPKKVGPTEFTQGFAEIT